jgi:hypothetical protein
VKCSPKATATSFAASPSGARGKTGSSARRSALGTRLEEARSEALLLAVMMEKRCGAAKVILFGSAATGRDTLNEKS